MRTTKFIAAFIRRSLAKMRTFIAALIRRILSNDVGTDINDAFWDVELNPENQNRPRLPSIVQHQERHRNFSHLNNNMMQVAPAA